ncbi:MAG: TIGR02391 family protein [Candidatus Riflebacteria bacterium]|nr:TIGR02391 family protein [Candidatus Riflebacteria bacterium]
MQQLNDQQLKSICAILAHTNNGLTKTELKNTLLYSHIEEIDEGSKNNNNGMYYKIESNKRDWLYACFANDISKCHNASNIFEFIENALSPISYTTEEKRDKYRWLLEETNKVLLLIGLQVGTDGKIRHEIKANTLDEVDRRVNSLSKKLHDRSIHSDVVKYCCQDYLRKDYFDAVFEAAKGLAERVREVTGLRNDGGELFQKAFSTKDPYLFFNAMQTESEISEFKGLKELLEAIFHLARNPVAHTPKVNWRVDETKALDILTLISFAHKYLDECHKMPRK